MTTSAYNLGNAGLASKIVRTKDLMRVAGVEVVPVLGIGAVCSGLSDADVEFGAGVGLEFLGVRSCIVPIWPVEISR